MNALKNQKGVSLIEAMLVSSVLLVVSMSIGSIMIQMQTATRTATRRYEVLELRGSVGKILADLPLCSCILSANSTPFNAANPNSVFDVSRVTASCLGTSAIIVQANSEVPGSTSQLAVDRIRMRNIRPTGAQNEFSGRLVVSFKNDAQSTTPLRPFEIQLKFLSDPAQPVAAKELESCTYVGSAESSGSSSSSTQVLGTCPTGMAMKGIESDGILCATINPSAASSFSELIPGAGCIGTACTTTDFGPCSGASCRTNGNYCTGFNCTATGSAASCSGAGCCAGPTCP